MPYFADPQMAKNAYLAFFILRRSKSITPSKAAW